ncbi:6868_t:CDS:2, partial [Gigaspora margarita]
EVFRLQLQMQNVLNKIWPPIFEEWFDELRPPILENAETCYVSLMRQCWDNKNEQNENSCENHSDIDDLISEYNTKSSSNDKSLSIDDLINEYNNKPTS